MATTTTYKLVQGDGKAVTQQVNDLLTQGWTLSGGPTVNPMTGEVVQALTLITGS